MKKDKQSLRIIASPFVLVGLIFIDTLAYGILIFIYSYPVARNQLDLLSHIICITFGGVFPTLALIGVIYRGFLSIITIDKFGLKISVFGIFCTMKLSWDEIYEISYYERVRPFLFFSKTCSVQNMEYNQIIKRKDVIQIELTRKVYQITKRFADKPIINLTEDKLKQLKFEK